MPLGPTTRSRRTRKGEALIRWSVILPCLYNSNPGMKRNIPRVDTAPQGVEALTPLGHCQLAGAHMTWSRRAARIAPWGNVEVPPHREGRSFHPLVGNPAISLQLQPRDETEHPPGRYRPAECGNPNPTGSLPIGWGSYDMEPARGENFPSGQRRGPAAPGREELPSTGR